MIGQTLGDRYQIEAVIGQGATATVYRVLDTRLGRTAAAKVLLPGVSNAVRQQFEEEARASAKLNHPALMAIYDVGRQGDQVYLIAELVQGKPLAEFIPAAPLVVADLGRKILLALEYAHRAGLVHRDLTPANIFILPNQQIKIMDLGLAVGTDTQTSGIAHMVVGTPAYLSPEQAQGKPVDARSDIYSMGVVLYELLTGQLPFTANDVGTLLLQHVRDVPKPPAQIVPGVPRFLEKTILRALEKRPDSRFSSAAEMAEALTEPTGTDVPTPPPLTPLIEHQPIRVAIVDDHALLRTTLIMALRYHPNIQIVGQGGDGQDAVELSARIHPDVLLLDLNMPNKNGLTALAEIKRDNPSVKILILSGRDESAYILQALRSGASGYVIKTADELSLIQAIEDVHAGKIVLGQGVADRLLESFRLAEQSDPLSPDEKAVLHQVALGVENNGGIGQALHLDEVYVTRLLMQAMDKLGVSDRIEAALIAIRSGWITLGGNGSPYVASQHGSP